MLFSRPCWSHRFILPLPYIVELQLVHLILFDKYLNFSIFCTFCNCSFPLNSHVFLWNIFLWPVDLSLAFILEQFLQDIGFIFFPEFGCPKTFLSCFLNILSLTVALTTVFMAPAVWCSTVLGAAISVVSCLYSLKLLNVFLIWLL